MLSVQKYPSWLLYTDASINSTSHGLALIYVFIRPTDIDCQVNF